MSADRKIADRVRLPVLQPREDEAAERDLLADRRDQREDDHRDPRLGDVRHDLAQRFLDRVETGKRYSTSATQLVDQRVERQRPTRRPRPGSAGSGQASRSVFAGAEVSITAMTSGGIRIENCPAATAARLVPIPCAARY